MKKYLLLGCACMALSAFADDTDITKGYTDCFVLTNTASVTSRYWNGDNTTHGGKPRLPEKPLSVGSGNVYPVRDGSSSFSSSVGWGTKDLVKVDLVELGKEPLGGKPRDPGRPLSIDDFLNNVRKNSSYSSSKPTIDDVTSLIDLLLKEGQSNG